MTLRYMNGCDNPKPGWSLGSGNATLPTFDSAGRTGRCVKLASTVQYLQGPALATSFTVGFAIKKIAGTSGSPDATTMLMPLTSSDGRSLFQLTQQGTNVTFSRRSSVSGFTVVGTAAAPSDFMDWTYVECKVVISNTVGSVVVRVNGNEIINATNNTWWDLNAPPFFQMLPPNTGGNHVTLYDDIYVLDSTDGTAAQGAPNNTFLGPIKIEALHPNGDGSSSQWVGSDGNSTNNSLLVDEVATDNNDYVETSTIGNRDLYSFENMTGVGTVIAVDVVSTAVAVDGGSPKVKTVAKQVTGGATNVGAGTTPGSVWGAVSDGIRAKAPDDAAWTVGKVNDSEFGVELG